jgi:Uma2 family endonuclease
MGTVVDWPWTTESFLAWEDRQEFKHEFVGGRVIPKSSGSVAHQRIVINLCNALMRLLQGRPLLAVQEMRLRIGARIRYPDVLVCAAPVDQATRTLTDAVAAFEVLSDDDATADLVEKLTEYSEMPSFRSYVLVEQTKVATTLWQRIGDSEWTASTYYSGWLFLPWIDVVLPLAEIYRDLTFPAQA